MKEAIIIMTALVTLAVSQKLPVKISFGNFKVEFNSSLNCYDTYPLDKHQGMQIAELKELNRTTDQ